MFWQTLCLRGPCEIQICLKERELNKEYKKDESKLIENMINENAKKVGQSLKIIKEIEKF